MAANHTVYITHATNVNNECSCSVEYPAHVFSSVRPSQVRVAEMDSPRCSLCRNITSCDHRRRKRINSKSCDKEREALLSISRDSSVFLDKIMSQIPSPVLCQSCCNILNNISNYKIKLAKLSETITNMIAAIICSCESVSSQVSICLSFRSSYPRCLALSIAIVLKSMAVHSLFTLVAWVM